MLMHLTVVVSLLAGPPGAPLKVVTSTTDLWDIARQVGGKRVTAKHISEGFQDPHFVEAKPSFVLDLQKADVWACVGLDLEKGWAPVLLAGARNQKIAPGSPGDVDVSRAIPLLDVPSGNVDRSQGDVHPLGNPHYWLDPANAKRIAKLFQDTYTRLDPDGAAEYASNAAAFGARLDAAENAWAPALAKLKGKPVVAWHTSWRYLAAYTGMNIVGFMEPKPGVPPSRRARGGARLRGLDPLRLPDRVGDHRGIRDPGVCGEGSGRRARGVRRSFTIPDSRLATRDSPPVDAPARGAAPRGRRRAGRR